MRDPIASMWDAVKSLLESKREQICSEITAHPRPIAGCDVHFNSLLDERAKIVRDLNRLSDLHSGCAAGGRDFSVIKEFIASSDAITNREKERIETALRGVSHFDS